MKHTPGTWEQSRGRHSPKDKDRQCFWVVNQAEDGRKDLMPRICDIYAPEGANGFSEGEANARLIAAAPELLEACTRILRAIKWERPGDRLTTEEMAEILHAAIEKASGNV